MLKKKDFAMSTRGLIVLIADSQVRCALYNHFDSDPGGLGSDILGFLTKEIDEQFTDKLKLCEFITIEQKKALIDKVGSHKFEDSYPWLTGTCGEQIFTHIQKSKNALQMENKINFAADSLFCEWCYVVDFDKKTFEVYSGFNKQKLEEGERFAYLNEMSEQKSAHRINDCYYPVKLVKSFMLSDLPTPQQFFVDCQSCDEEE